ncbi:hypothetical protein G3I67_09335 [Orrella sp. NBD-18]|uniref:Uncharacterized protein n=1 Tax=Sheuella amnicola TaxID=2707330 RepID=A0A6B2QZI2_9BURK|nr:hypothetical protein [Sheuella amnicola]NDY83432.1 hypothetical protein [Sheuella amnicola]
MRTLFFILIVINVAVFATAQGVFGEPRSQKGKTAATQIKPQIQPDAVKVSRARLENR